MDVTHFCNHITQLIAYDFCRILFFRRKSLGSNHTEVEDMTRRREHQKVGIRRGSLQKAFNTTEMQMEWWSDERIGPLQQERQLVSMLQNLGSY